MEVASQTMTRGHWIRAQAAKKGRLNIYVGCMKGLALIQCDSARVLRYCDLFGELLKFFAHQKIWVHHDTVDDGRANDDASRFS